jgi:hypothetical protein
LPRAELAAHRCLQVGTVDALAVVVSVMAEAVRGSFACMGLPLPPWRESRALLSKWLPNQYNDVPVPGRGGGLQFLPPGSLASMRGGARLRGSAAARPGPAVALVCDRFQPARVVSGFFVALGWHGARGQAAADCGSSAAGPPGSVGAAAGQARVAANRARLAQLLPPMRTFRLGA